jgi:hypothetical protein
MVKLMGITKVVDVGVALAMLSVSICAGNQLVCEKCSLENLRFLDGCRE